MFVQRYITLDSQYYLNHTQFLSKSRTWGIELFYRRFRIL